MSVMLHDLIRPLLAEMTNPAFIGRAGMLLPAIGDLARTMARRPPSFSIRETNKEIVVEAEAPGFEPENLDVQIQDDMLVITGTEQKGKEDGDMFEREKFKQAFTLPKELQKSEINASYQRGILRVALPKPPEAQEMQPQKRVRIPIHTCGEEGGGKDEAYVCPACRDGTCSYELDSS